VVSEISASTQEQASGIQQVSTAITAIDNTMQQNAALVEEAAAAAASLQRQAESLQSSVGFFHT
jgi:methyl-accepting chemotaxis protein